MHHWQDIWEFPLKQKKDAIECINKLHSETIDTALINGKPYFAVAGIGYDAEIAAKFRK